MKVGQRREHPFTLNHRDTLGGTIGQNGVMRTLTIVRHCESSPAEGAQPDFDRTLSERGRRQCEQLREWASDPNELGRFGPATALVSAAARTRETFVRSFEGTALVGHHEFSELIYNGHREVTGEDLLSELAALDPVTTSLLIVAHNPSVLELALDLCAKPPRRLVEGHFKVGAAYELALRDDEPIGRGPYELVAKYRPD